MDVDFLIAKGYLSKIVPATELADKEFVESNYDLKCAKNALSSEDWKWAIVKAYYSMFHAAKGVLFLMGLKEKSHYVVGEVLEILSKEGKLESKFVNDFRAAMSAREGANYHYKHPQHAAEEMVELAGGFTERMKKLARVIGK